MKKILGTVLAIILVSSILAGCGKDETTGTETTPAATDAAPAATDAAPAATDAAPAATDATPAATDAGATEEAAVDLTDYPVMWCSEMSPLYPDTYDNHHLTTLASETYERTSIIGTLWIGYRLIDDTHAEEFRHYRFNDDIDTSVMVTSQDESLNINNAIKIGDRDEEEITATYTYEINGTELIITNEQTSKTSTLEFTSDFTSIVDGPYEYTYLTDF